MSVMAHPRTWSITPSDAPRSEVPLLMTDSRWAPVMSWRRSVGLKLAWT